MRPTSRQDFLTNWHCVCAATGVRVYRVYAPCIHVMVSPDPRGLLWVVHLGLFFKEQQLINHEAVVGVFDHLSQAPHDCLFISRVLCLLVAKACLFQVTVRSLKLLFPKFLLTLTGQMSRSVINKNIISSE